MYLLVNVGGPETSNSAFVGLRREEGGSGVSKRLLEVLNDDHGLTYSKRLRCG